MTVDLLSALQDCGEYMDVVGGKWWQIPPGILKVDSAPIYSPSFGSSYS
jgi:hypothetical protein